MVHVDHVLVERLHAVVLHHDVARFMQEREVVQVAWRVQTTDIYNEHEIDTCGLWTMEYKQKDVGNKNLACFCKLKQWGALILPILVKMELVFTQSASRVVLQIKPWIVISGNRRERRLSSSDVLPFASTCYLIIVAVTPVLKYQTFQEDLRSLRM